jgi:twitching motility two-component system response regulator PilG
MQFGRSRTVLVVDDSRTIQMTAKRFLDHARVEVVTAKDGYEAVKAMYEHAPGLVFVDVMMPRIDGYKFCSVVKSNPAFAATPVIMLTSKDGLIDRARAKLVQADGYLIKPFTKGSMAEIITRYLP